MGYTHFKGISITEHGYAVGKKGQETNVIDSTGQVSLASLNAVSKGLLALEVSFETGEQTTHTIEFPFKVTINKLRAFVTKDLAGTDAGTITAKNNAGTAMTGGTITLAASSAVGTVGTATPTANNVIDTGQVLQLTVAKTTAGGRARVEIQYTRT
jgi:predicted ATP-grasp superfamily ATP-dependent carboligase